MGPMHHRERGEEEKKKIYRSQTLTSSAEKRVENGVFLLMWCLFLLQSCCRGFFCRCDAADLRRAGAQYGNMASWVCAGSVRRAASELDAAAGVWLHCK